MPFLKTSVLTSLFIIVSFNLSAQEYKYTGEFALGHSAPSNENFPSRKAQSQLWFHVSKEKNDSGIQWQQWLKSTETGISLLYTNYGNNKVFGSSYSILPFIRFRSFNNDKYHTYIGLGTSYFTKEFDLVENPLNRAVSTDLTWILRVRLDYEFYESNNWNYNTGISVVHNSNGHTSLPNNGYNSFLLSVSATYDPSKKQQTTETPYLFKKSKTSYFSVFHGLGTTVFSDLDYFNQKKEVYTLGAEYGKTYNRTLKIGIGAFYRFYQHYYDYIDDNEFLVRENQRFSYMNGDPFSNASNIGVYVKGELLFNYIGVELAIGANFHKPAYKIDYYINQGWENPPREFPDYWEFADFDTKYKLKQLLNTRLGVNYYPLGTNELKPHNFYVGIHINANYGQADFTELRVGYVYEFGKK